MDIASTAWLNPTMRSGLLALGVLCLAASVVAQDTTPPTVVTHPSGTSVFLGDTVTLTAAFNGATPLTYQWQKNNAAIPGATNTSLTLSAVTSNDSGLYHLTASNAYGSASTVPALVQVTKRPQTITFNAPTSSAVAGSSIALNASSTSGLPIAFTLVSGAGTVSGNLLTSLGGTLVVRASQAGDDTFAPAEPVERTFSFVAGGLAPFITSAPQDQTVVAGSSVTFRAAAIGTPAPAYQWSKDGVPISGATSTVLTLASATTADAGRYTITATNSSGTSVATANLVVRAPPQILTAPESQSIFAGDSLTLRVTASGVPAPTFQWRRNGAVLPGATNSSFTLATATAANAGNYDVVVTNALGTVTSPAAIVTITTRDFSGVYFGRFAGEAGEFALVVRPDRSALFLGHLPSRQTGIVVQNLVVDLAGGFSATTSLIAPNPQSVSVRGAIVEATGVVSGTVSGLGVTFDGTRTSRSGGASALAGIYTLAAIGTAGDRGYLVVAPDTQAFALSFSGAAVDSGRGSIDSAGRLSTRTVAGAAVDLAINNGAVSGTAAIGSRTSVIAGAIESRAGTEHLVNLSVRTVTSPGAANLITGFVITGTASKQVLIRAAGPALAVAPFNIANVVGDPTLQLFRGATAIAQNDDWGTPAANTAALTAAATRAGAFPFRAGSQDAALLMTLTPGAYSVVIGGGTGTALTEVYEVLEANEVAGSRRLVNVSTRGLITPLAPFIAGFVITGTGPQRVLIRAVGPTLSAPPFNVAGALPNPQLTLFRGAAAVKTNDDWFRDPDAALIRDTAARAGAFALGASSLDAAILVFLEPGAYTAQITAVNPNATGLALIEIYEAAP
jgi:hypothetical protein